jgi:predicted ATPase
MMTLSSLELRLSEDISLDEYPYNLPWIEGLARLTFDVPVTFFIGENGRGKSTLLEAIAVGLGFNAEGGSRNFVFSTQATHSNLYKHLRLARSKPVNSSGFFFRSESFYNLASEIDKLDAEPAGSPFIKDSYGGRSLHTQSRGESILALIMHRFNNTGLYLLDEPEAGLSLTSQVAIMLRIRDLAAAGAQFIIATHSPFLLALPAAKIYSFDGDSIEVLEYRQTIQYVLAKRFMSDELFLNLGDDLHRPKV